MRLAALIGKSKNKEVSAILNGEVRRGNHISHNGPGGRYFLTGENWYNPRRSTNHHLFWLGFPYRSNRFLKQLFYSALHPTQQVVKEVTENISPVPRRMHRFLAANRNFFGYAQQEDFRIALLNCSENYLDLYLSANCPGLYVYDLRDFLGQILVTNEVRNFENILPPETKIIEFPKGFIWGLHYLKDETWSFHKWKAAVSRGMRKKGFTHDASFDWDKYVDNDLGPSLLTSKIELAPEDTLPAPEIEQDQITVWHSLRNFFQRSKTSGS